MSHGFLLPYCTRFQTPSNMETGDRRPETEIYRAIFGLTVHPWPLNHAALGCSGPNGGVIAAFLTRGRTGWVALRQIGTSNEERTNELPTCTMGVATVAT